MWVGGRNDVSWNIRPRTSADVRALVRDVLVQLTERLRAEQLVAKVVTIKLKHRKPGAGEPRKKGGCGACDLWTHSLALAHPTRELDHLLATALQLASLSARAITDIRGVGVALTKLANDCPVKRAAHVGSKGDVPRGSDRNVADMLRSTSSRPSGAHCVIHIKKSCVLYTLECDPVYRVERATTARTLWLCISVTVFA